MYLKRVNKVVSVLTVITFLCTNTLYAAPSSRFLLRPNLAFEKNLPEGSLTKKAERIWALLAARVISDLIKKKDRVNLIDLQAEFPDRLRDTLTGKGLIVELKEGRKAIQLKAGDEYLSINRTDGTVRSSSESQYYMTSDENEVVLARGETGKKLGSNTGVEDETLKKTVPLPLRTFLAGVAGFQEAIVASPSDLRKAQPKLAQSFLKIVKQVAGMAKDFEAKNPLYAPAYIYESLCFVKIKGNRRLGFIVTPFEQRRASRKLDVLVFDAPSASVENYTRERIDLSSIEMLSSIAERVEEEDIISLALMFRSEYLDNPRGPGIDKTRQSAKALFEYFTLKKEAAAEEILNLDEDLINSLRGTNAWIRERIRQLKEGRLSEEILNNWFIDVIQGRPQLVQYLLYTADATTFWYDLLFDLDYMRQVLSLRSDTGVDYVQTAYEEAVVASWIYLHRAKFKSYLVEREVESRSGDFELTLSTETLGMPGDLTLRKTSAEFATCLNCVGRPCQHGKLGSVAGGIRTKANFIDSIISNIRYGKLTARKQLEGKKVDNLDKPVIENMYEYGRPLLIDNDAITRWLDRTRGELEKERNSLIKKAEEIEKEVKATGEPFCPLEVPIADMFRFMKDGRFEDALKILNESSFLAGLFGLICPQEYLCQAGCTMAGITDRPLPIDIGKLEYLIELTYLRLKGKLPVPKIKKPTGKYVAIIGSGPAGLQAAYDLAREGHKVVIFEHLHKVGGVLVYGIPTFRLPPELLEEKVRILKEMGVRFVTNTIIGENGAFTIEELRKSFDTVILGVGAGQSNRMEMSGKIVMLDEQTKRARLETVKGGRRRPIPGRTLTGIYSAYDFLSSTYLMNAIKPGYKTPIPLSKKIADAFRKSLESGGREVEINIVVEGVGNVALDSARTALRWIMTLNRMYGTKVKPNIIVLYRRPKEDLPEKARDEELAHIREELKYLSEAGLGAGNVEAHELHQAIEYLGDEDGHVVAIRTIRYDKAGVKEGILVDIPADQVMEALGAKPATEVLGPNVPLDKDGYIRIADHSTMLVKGLDGSDGLARVYAMGDCAQAGEHINPRMVGTAVLAASQAKWASTNAIEFLADRAPIIERAIDVEETFFAPKPMYQILRRRQLAKRIIKDKDGEVIEEQRIVEFTVYAPYVARKIRPGQFLTIMADKYSEKIPITFAESGEEEGTIRFTVQEVGESTRIINDMKKGESFYAITGPAGTPSIFSGLKGEVSLVGMGTGIAAIVGIAMERARLDKKLQDLKSKITHNANPENIFPMLQEVFSGLRLAKPEIVDDIITATRNRDYDQVNSLLASFSESIESIELDLPDSSIAKDVEELRISIAALVDSIERDEHELDLQVKQEAYTALDDIWETLEKIQRAKALKEIAVLIGEKEDYEGALSRLKEVIGEGFKTKVFLAAQNKKLLIYKEELENAIGKENIFIALEDETGFNASKEGYASEDSDKNRFFKGFGTVAFGDYLGRTQTSMSGLLVAGPAIAMPIFVNVVKKANRPAILSSRKVWMSTNPPMYCTYGGCLRCLIKTESGLDWRGCLGPEKEADMIIGKTILTRLAAAAPQRIQGEETFVVLHPHRDKAITDIMKALEEMVYIPTMDGRLFSVISDNGDSFVAELKDGILGDGLTRDEFIAILKNIDWDRLGIRAPVQKGLYAERIATILGLESEEVTGSLKVSTSDSSDEAIASNASIQDLFTTETELPLISIEAIGDFREVIIAPRGFLKLKPLLEKIGDKKTLEEVSRLKGNEFMYVLDKDGKAIALILRNEERQKEVLWVKGDPSPSLFQYLMLRSFLQGKTIGENITVDGIRDGTEILTQGARVAAATSNLFDKSGWTTRMAVHSPETCVECGLCSLVCPEGAIPYEEVLSLQSGRIVFKVRPDKCTGCAVCTVVCPYEGQALRMIEKTDLRQLAISLDTNPEGRGVVIDGETAVQFEKMFAKDGFDGLKELLGVEDIDVFSESKDFIQIRYEINGTVYLITFDRAKKRLIIKPHRTFAVVGFDKENFSLANALREKGFGIVVLLSTKDEGFTKKSEQAKKQGLEVYTIETPSGKMGVNGNLQDLLNNAQYLRFTKAVSVDTTPIRHLLGLEEYLKFTGIIGGHTGDNIRNPVDLLPTGNMDFDEVMKRFAPPWYKRILGIAPGHVLCPTCGQGSDMAMLSKILEEFKEHFAPTIVLTTGCLEVSTTNFPINAWRMPAVHGNYTASAGILAGIMYVYEWLIRMGKRIFGKRDLLPIVIMGDGGFAIGVNVILGALEKGLPMLLILEDNGGTENTGAQASTLSPIGVKAPGLSGVKMTSGLNIPDIVKGAGSNLYYAQVSNAYPEDFEEKMRHAMEWIRQGRGPAVMHCKNTACPTGWKSDPSQSHQEATLSVQTAVGKTILFEQVGDHVRITQPPLPRDGKIYINTDHLISLEYELRHLKDKGGKILLSDQQVEDMISYVEKRKKLLLQKELERKKPRKAGLPSVELDYEGLTEKIVLRYFNLPLESDLLRSRLDILGLEEDEIKKILDYRTLDLKFKSKQGVIDVLEIDEGRYNVIAEEVMEFAIGSGEIKEVIKDFTETEKAGEIDFEVEQTFESIKDILKVPGIGPATFSKIESYLTLEPRRPHVTEYAKRQGRYKGVYGPGKEWLLEYLQKEIDNYIEMLTRRHEESKEFFKEFDRVLAKGEKLEKDEFKYKSGREAHNEVLVLGREVPPDPQRQDRIAERKKRLGKRTFEERIHSRAGQGGITYANLVGTVAAEAEEVDLKVSPRFGIARTGDELSIYVRMGNEVRQRTPVTEPDLVTVIDESLLDLPQVMGGIKPSGMLLVNTKRSPRDIRNQLERNNVKLNDIKIFTIDASGIGMKYLGRDFPNPPMFAARVLISQLTDVDLGSAENAIDYIRQDLIRAFGPRIADLNCKAMEEAILSLKVESGTFEEMRDEFLASREPVEVESIETRTEAPRGTVRLFNANQATALATAQMAHIDPTVVDVYPTTPATEGGEKMAEYQDLGVPVISYLEPAEDSVGGAMIGIGLAGGIGRTWTTSVASSYMWNQHWMDAYGKRIPLVLNIPIRALNIGSLSIFPDESDIAFIRDYGLFLRARNSQEAYYLEFIATRIAKKLRIPVAVVYTGFRNSHTKEPTRIIEDYDKIEEYMLKSEFSIDDTIFDQEHPFLSGPVTGMQVTHELVTEVFETVSRESGPIIKGAFSEFERLFGVRFNSFIDYKTEDAEEIIIVQGDIGETIETVVDELRLKGRKVGIIEITQVRPFPDGKLRETLKRIKPRTITVLDNSSSAFLYTDVVVALKGTKIPVWGPVIYGLGGREFYSGDARLLYDTLEAFSIIQGLDKRNASPLTQKLLRELVEKDTITVEGVPTYLELSARFYKLSSPETIFTPNELELWNSKPPTENTALKEWLSSMQRLENRLDLQLKLIERVKDGSYRELQLGDEEKGVLDKILREFDEIGLAVYRNVASQVEGRVGGKSIATLLDLLNQAGELTGITDFKESEIIRKLTKGEALELFGSDADYYFGARRKYNQDKLMHALIIELAIKLSRRLLESGKGSDAKRLMAAQALLDLSEVYDDRKTASEEIGRLADLDPTLAARARGRSETSKKLASNTNVNISEFKNEILLFLGGEVESHLEEFNRILEQLDQSQVAIVLVRDDKQKRAIDYDFRLRYDDIPYNFEVMILKEAGLEGFDFDRVMNEDGYGINGIPHIRFVPLSDVLKYPEIKASKVGV